MRTKLFFLVAVLYLSCTSCKKDYEIQEESNVFDTSALVKVNGPIVVPGDPDPDPPYYSQLDPNHPFMVSSKIDGGHILEYKANPIYTGSLGTPSQYEWTIEVYNEDSNLAFSGTASTPSINVSYMANTTFRFSLNVIYGSTPYVGANVTVINQQTLNAFSREFAKDVTQSSSVINTEVSIEFCLMYPLGNVIQACDDTNYVSGGGFGDTGGGVTANLILP